MNDTTKTGQTVSSNVYEPPKAELAATGGESDKYYVVGKRKFYLLSIMTFTMYFVYWFYENFRRIKARTGDSMWPAMRGVFSIVFAHNLCRRIDSDLKESNLDMQWQPEATATLYVVLVIASNVVDRVLDVSGAAPLLSVLTLGIVPAIAMVMYPAQRGINLVSGDADGSSNSRLGGLNWVWLVIGGLLWLGVLLDTIGRLFFPEWLAE